MAKKYEVKFEYSDAMSNWDWRSQQCQLFAENKSEAIQKCTKLYGLGVDCEYKIVEVKEV